MSPDMKTVAITALLGAIFALPIILGRRNVVAVRVEGQAARKTGERDTNLLYDVDDFVTE